MPFDDFRVIFVEVTYLDNQVESFPIAPDAPEDKGYYRTWHWSEDGSQLIVKTGPEELLNRVHVPLQHVRKIRLWSDQMHPRADEAEPPQDEPDDDSGDGGDREPRHPGPRVPDPLSGAQPVPSDLPMILRTSNSNFTGSFGGQGGAIQVYPPAQPVPDPEHVRPRQ